MGNEAFGRVTRGLLLEQTADLLRKGILEGRLRPGEKLIESRLAEEFGVSRGPVREALRLLKEHGLVRSEPHRGTFVADLTVQDVVEVLTIRELLEPFAMRLALSDPDVDLLPALRTAMDTMHECAREGDAEGLAETHTQLHGSFYTHAGHRLLGLLWDRLQVTLRLYVTVHRSSFGSLGEIAAQHDRMLRLVADRDVIGLEEEIHNHLRTNLQKVIASLGESESETALRWLERVRTGRTRSVAEPLARPAEPS